MMSAKLRYVAFVRCRRNSIFETVGLICAHLLADQRQHLLRTSRNLDCNLRRRDGPMANRGSKAKFRKGQVVKHRIAGGFYMKIIGYKGLVGDHPAWLTMEQGKITQYWEWQLRSLNKSEAGQ